MSICISDISFAYSKDKPILNDINIDIPKGQTHAIVGASGCGKSTLLRLISGILPKTKSDTFNGKITIDDIVPNEYIKKGKLAFMFQEATLMPNLTVRENIAFPLKIKGSINYENVDTLIQMVGLTEYADYLPKQLSGGMKTRVALARSFVTNPEYLLLDEPFSALDIAWKSKLYIELEKLREQFNTTVIIVTHDVQEALLLASKIIILGKNGFIINEEINSSSSSTLDRVTNIAKYNDTDDFRKSFSSIQKWIMNDASRTITSEHEAEIIFNQIISVAGNEKLERQLNDSLVKIYAYSNNEKNNRLLFESFEKGTSYFKNELIWDILTFDNIDDKKVEIIFNYYLNNIEEISTQARQSYYKLEPNKLFDKLLQDINNDAYHTKKRWVFLCDMYASSEIEKVLKYLEDTENGKIEKLNYPLAKRIANHVKTKMKNEKLDSLHTA